MCLFHTWKEIKRELFSTITTHPKTGEKLSQYAITTITYQCSKCGEFKQIDLDGDLTK